MRYLKHAAVLLIAVSLAVTLFVAGCSKEKPAATVNGTDIPMSEVDKKLAQLEKIQPTAFKGKDAETRKQQYRKQIVDYLVNEQIIRQEAEKQKIAINDKDVDKRFSEMQKSSNKSTKEIEDILKKQGTTIAEFKEGLKTQMIAQKLFQKITEKIKITDDEVKKYYEKNKETEFKEPEKVKAQQILTEKEEDANKAKAELDGGADFGEVVKKYSTDQSTKDKKGELPPLSKEQVVPEFAKEVFAKEAGETTGVFKSTYGYHIVKVIEKTPARQKSFDEVKDLIKQQQLSKNKDAAFQKWLEDIKKKSDIKTYV